MSNLPMGAEFDDSEPFNQSDINDFDGYCSRCDAEEIERLVNQTSLDNEVEQNLEKAQDDAGLCEQCHREDLADLNREDAALGLI